MGFSQVEDILLELQKNLDSALQWHFEGIKNKTNFFLKISVRRIPFLHGLAPETTNAIAWNSQRMKEKSIAESGILDSSTPLPKGKYVSPAPELGVFPATSKRLNVHKTYMNVHNTPHSPVSSLSGWWSCYLGQEDPLEAERSLTSELCKDTPTLWGKDRK